MAAKQIGEVARKMGYVVLDFAYIVRMWKIKRKKCCNLAAIILEEENMTDDFDICSDRNNLLS